MHQLQGWFSGEVNKYRFFPGIHVYLSNTTRRSLISRLFTVHDSIVARSGSFESELLLPGETLSTFPLSSVTPIGPLMPLSTFNIPYDGHTSPSVSQTHFIFRGDVSLNLTNATGPSVVRATSIMTGDPLSLVRSIVDLKTSRSSVPGIQGVLRHPSEGL